MRLVSFDSCTTHVDPYSSPNRSGIPAWERLIGCPLCLDERVSLITGIFSDRDETEVVERLQGDNAQAFVNTVDEVLSTIPSTFRDSAH